MLIYYFLFPSLVSFLIFSKYWIVYYWSVLLKYWCFALSLHSPKLLFTLLQVLSWYHIIKTIKYKHAFVYTLERQGLQMASLGLEGTRKDRSSRYLRPTSTWIGSMSSSCLNIVVGVGKINIQAWINHHRLTGYISPGKH